MTYYSITTASNENTQNPDAERVERRRPDGGGWTRPLGHRSNDRIPPRRLATTENERTPIDANERGTKKILPTHPARPQFFDWHAHESHGHRHRAHPQLLCPQAPQVVAFAHAHPPGAHAQLPAHLSHAMTRKKRKNSVRSFVRSRVVSRARECGDAPSTSIRRGCVRSIEPSRDASCVRRVMTREQSPRPPRARRVPSTDRRRSVAVGRLPTSHDSTRALHTATTRTRKSKPPVSPHR